MSSIKSVLVLRHLKVQNANAISGLTYGFPAISHFLGFTHALSRKLEQTKGLTLGGCAVIAHNTQLQSQPLGQRGAQVFALTRNPLTKEEKTAPFNEEGRMHLDISMIIECEFDSNALAAPLESSISELTAWLEQQIYCQRLAGGTILSLEQVTWQEKFEGNDLRRLRRNLLPGFALVCRHDLLTEYHQTRLEQEPQAELLDSLLDFVTLRFRAEPTDDTQKRDYKHWPKQPKPDPKPAAGYLVPLAVGYQAISELQAAGSLTSSRDRTTPFALVESIYSLGQWVSPHRVDDLNQLMWRYQYQAPTYLFQNHYHPPKSPSTFQEELSDEELNSIQSIF